MTPPVRDDDRGAVLVEFALVALVFALLLAATVDLGRMTFTAQILQDAARVGARELSITPLLATATFDEALATPNVKARVFDADKLVIDLTGVVDFDLNATCASLPAVNRQLCPLMFIDSTSIAGVTLLRYPGTLLRDTTTGAYTIKVPLITARGANGAETAVDWVSVVEEVRADPDPANGPFVLKTSNPAGPSGLAAVRVNYPFQAAALSSFRPDPGGPLVPNAGHVNIADDSAITAPPSGYEFAAEDTTAAGPNAGRLGLGQQLAFAGRTVRPYRRVLSAQSIYRREVFQ